MLLMGRSASAALKRGVRLDDPERRISAVASAEHAKRGRVDLGTSRRRRR